LTAIAVDSGGRGYIVEELPPPGKVYSYDGIATLNGTLSPTRTIAGINTQLNGPIRVFLEESPALRGPNSKFRSTCHDGWSTSDGFCNSVASLPVDVSAR